MRVCPSNSGQVGSDLPLVQLITAIGEPHFAQRTIEFVNNRLMVDHISFFLLDRELVPHFLGGASRNDSQTALLAGRLYERAMFHRYDPNPRQIRTRSADEDVMIFRQRAADIRDPEYRDRLYRRFNLLERISLIRAVSGRWFVISVYRNVQSGSFEPRDINLLREMGALLVACTAKHASLAAGELAAEPASRSRDYLESLLKSIEPRLTRREQQVCSLALTGETVGGIAASLGIQQSTVATLRRRAYAKLGITRLNGLFGLCISRIAR
jgi:DNA-binding CsgD family transcriptional regulator